MFSDQFAVNTNGERFYDITPEVKNMADRSKISDGVLGIFIMHTSCALTISENFDPTAKSDLETFMKYLVPRNLEFIRHRMEGPDDSPSHMKSILLHQNLMIPIENGELCLGTWQGIFLAEFRDAPHTRKIKVKVLS